MTINYCLPIINKSQDAIDGIISKSSKDYQYFEIWLDYIKEIDVDKLLILSTENPGKLILLFRRERLEAIQTPIDKRTEILGKLNGADVIFDFDISVQKDELDFITEQGLNIKKIVSYHNYELTPTETEFLDLLGEMEKLNPQICKFSTFCQNPNDALRLMKLQQKIIADQFRHIVLGMGSYGDITRVFGTLWGNEMVFAAMNKENETAPEQLTKKQLEDLFGVLNIY